MAGMPMQTRPTRFTDDEWSAVAICAEKEGVTMADIVRIGTLAYVSFMLARRADEMTFGADKIYAAAREMVQLYPL
jgi:hypothetical protein